MDDRQYSLLEHLKSLRSCIIRSLLGLVICFIFAIFFSDEILSYLRKPMMNVLGNSAKFVVLVPHEYFFSKIKAAIVAGIFLSSPWIFFQIWLFIAPGLYKKEKYYSVVFVLAGAFFFIAGAFFSYLIVFPPMFSFFVSTLPSSIEGAYSVGMLFGFATSMLLAFGLVFETPVFVFMIVLLDIVEISSLIKFRRYVFVLAFVLGAILTPPDPLTQVFLALPLIILYELGLFFAKIMIFKRKLAVHSKTKL